MAKRSSPTEVVPVIPARVEGTMPAVLPEDPKVPAPTMAAPLLRAQKLQLMAGQVMARGLGNQAATAAVLPLSFDSSTWHELTLIQLAIFKRLVQQQQDLVGGCQEIAQGYSQLKTANTMSKFVEQEYNAVAQFGALLTSYTASVVSLMENVQVDYAYWISQKSAENHAGTAQAV